MIINVFNRTKYRINGKFFESIIGMILRKSGLRTGRIILDLSFVSSWTIARVNKIYRKINSPTDVLAFNYLDVSEFSNFGARKDTKQDRILRNKPVMFPVGVPYLGEILIAPGVIKKNASKYRVSFKYEMSRVLVHGILHLLGYEHEKSIKKRGEMEGAEERILLKLKMENVCLRREKQPRKI